VKCLLDTHILLGAASAPERLSPRALAIISDESSELVFSAASIWEVAIKSSLGLKDFSADPHLLRRGLLDAGFAELPIRSEHAAAVVDLEAIYREPFDRILVAQSRYEGFVLVTSDASLADYGGTIELV
jgi:PIN domain nuclease of toxin-antitoxin system